MTAAEVLIKIRTFFEGSGSQQADASLQKTASTAAKTGQQVAQAGQKGADGLNVMSVATAAMQGNFQAAASAAVPLLEKSKAVGLSMTQLSLGGALLGAVITGLRAMSEWADAAAQRISKIQMDNLTNKVNASAEAYEKLTQAMTEAAALADGELAYNNSMVDAYTRRALAVNELAKRQELLGTNDESKRAEIEAKYAKNAASITGESDDKKGDNQLARSLRRESEIQQSINAAEERRLELIEEANAALRRSQQDASRSRADLSFSRMLPLIGTGKESFVTNNASAQNALGLTASSIGNARSLEAEIKKLQNEKEELLRAREVAGLNSGSGQIERRAADIAMQTSSGDRQRANQEGLYSAAENLQGVASRFAPSDQQAIGEELNRLDKAGNLTVEAVTRMTQNLERIVKAYEVQESRMRNIQ